MPAKTMPALSMSQTKEDLVKYLGLRPETYVAMAKETDAAYKWLTVGTQHLKPNCTREPPYDWSDITEASKELAMVRLSQSGDSHTAQFWSLGDERLADGCPNWIARWFLYHKFRYRDGRNRGKESKGVARSGGSSKGGSSRSKEAQNQSGSQTFSKFKRDTVSPSRSAYSGYSPEGPNYQTVSSGSSYYSASPYSNPSNSISRSSAISNESTGQQASFYDPVKGYWIPKG